ncbi:MAG: NAD(P)H-dependent glycerol-3-phosphate dehydrogenase [bacterium]|nr:NAD(P)H-dependent glycerol-3-phosphate dehydrogenase [bacterium]
MANKKTVSILGAGAMGWGIAYILSAYQKAEVKVWDRDSQLINEAKKTRQNLKHSDPAITLPQEVLLSDNLEEITNGSYLTLLAVPSFAVREICQKISGLTFSALLMISKGMEKDTSLLPFQIAEEVLGKINILHLTGAGYGKEVHKKIPATEALACRNENLLKEIKSLFETDWLTIKTSTNLLGTQLAGALKNVMVIGIGLAEAGKENQEVKAKLIEEGVQEMIKLGKVMGAKEETFWGPAGKGDLEISADPLSRNYRLGQSFAEKGIDEVQKELKEKGITVEGFHTAWAAYRLAKDKNVQLPIIEEVYKVIYEKKNPKASAESLIRLVIPN